jgi:hypothetical protein
VPGRPCVVLDPGMQRRSLFGNREISGLTGLVVTERSASGRRGVEADDARAGEVRPFYSSDEAGEQDRATGGGVRGAKGRGRGKHGRATHAPDSEPGERVPGARPCTESNAAKEEGTVHRFAPLCDGRSTGGRFFQPQAGSGSGSRWNDMAELQARPGSQPDEVARAGASRHV